MARLHPVEAAACVQGTWIGRPPQALEAFCIDTRILQPGQVFVALRGERADGHAFLADARARGAAAALVERADPAAGLPQLVVADSRAALQALARAWRRRFRGPVVGITGSFGKTTVKEMLAAALGEGWHRTPANLNNDLGVPLSLLGIDPQRHSGALIEAGINRPGEMDLLAGMIQPDRVVITAVGPAHLERLGDLEGVAREKARLARALPPGGDVYFSSGLLAHAAFRDLPPGVRVHVLCRTGDPVPPPAAGRFVYHYNWTELDGSRGMGELTTRPPMPPFAVRFPAGSPGMVANLALVTHVALHLGAPAAAVAERLAAWQPFHQRGQILRAGKATYYVDCYNANPGSMIDSARRFASLFAGEPQLFVLGSMNELGPAAEFWHRETGRQLPVRRDAEVYLIGAGADWLAEGLRAAGVPESQLHRVADLESLRPRLRAFQGAIFLKGSRRHGLEALLPAPDLPC